MCYCFHIVHEPLQVPTATLAQFANITDDYVAMGLHHRTIYAAMVSYMDRAVGDIVSLLRRTEDTAAAAAAPAGGDAAEAIASMWDRTLIVFQTDNGGPSFAGGLPTANNWPHKGTKSSNFEGGIRGNAFISGGFLRAHVTDAARLGARLDGITHMADWYATFAALAGVDPTDHKAAKAGLPPIDSLDLWPYLSGAAAQSPRTEFLVDPDTLVMGGWKLMGANPRNASDAAGMGAQLPYACWMGPRYPNGTDDPKCHRFENCTALGGCLYNLIDDRAEHVDLAATHPAKLLEMQTRLAALQPTIFVPDRGYDDGLADKFAAEAHGGYWGPFILEDGDDPSNAADEQ
jgi:arylsulfatase I/J